ncbi:MAG: EFR1 family ferrodoxin [Spirochaetales bacterium]|nr:EFR1 family ferrodoxin [Spirochaetales bacterium]
MRAEGPDQSWDIVFFSGTGGTRRAAEELRKQMETYGGRPVVTELGARRPDTGQSHGAMGKQIILMFPVYAFDAPPLLYDWISSRSLSGVCFTVVSVSGGGEMWPNTGCRARLITAIEQQGGSVIHEAMLIMPVNFLIPGGDHLNMALLQILPDKIRALVKDLKEEKYIRKKDRLGLFQRAVAAAEKAGARRAGRQFTAGENCSFCGLCAALCPRGNIEISGNRVVFQNSCMLCMRCVYNCPEHAIQSKSSFVLKEGFDLDDLERRMSGVQLIPPEQCARGLLWKEVRNYLGP